MKKILGINPGSTSTKIAVFHDTEPVFHRVIRHTVEELKPFPRVCDQYEYRRDLVLKALAEGGIPFEFDAVVGRGGLTRPIPGGVYEVNDEMVNDLRHAHRDHACNLGSIIALALAREIPDCHAFMADPGIVDEMDPIAHITGAPQLPRMTTWHALNQRAIGRRFAAELTAEHPEHPVRYEDMNLIICHLGGGISIGAHKDGKCIDVNNAFDGEGPFSPERAGTLPPGKLIDICYSGRYTREEMRKRLSGKGGLAAHLGTVDMPEIQARIAAGDTHAAMIVDAMIYQIAKSVGALTPAFFGKVDAILITGGLAYSDYIIPRLKQLIKHIAPIKVYPGEDELTALASNALGALNGTMPIQTYTSEPTQSEEEVRQRRPLRFFRLSIPEQREAVRTWIRKVLKLDV